MVESSVYRIPAVDLITFCGVVAEDVLSPHGALLLSRDADFAALSPSKRRGFAFSLLNAGVYSVAVRERPELSLNEILEVMARGKRPPEQRFRNLYEDAMYYLTSFCEKVFSGGPGTLQSFTLLRAGRMLAEAVAADPDIPLHLGFVLRKDNLLLSHSINVGLLSAFLAHRMFPDREMTAVSVAAGGLLHDLGKTYISEEILNKPGALSEKEYETIRRHPLVGEAALRKSGVTDSVMLKMVRNHHERMDGTGYPDGLSGESIPIAARIAAVADVFDAVTSERAYKKRMSGRKGVSLLMDSIGTHLDSEVVRVFVGAFGMYPPGAEVVLSDGRSGVVVAPGERGVLRPRVLLHRDERGDELSSAVFLDLAAAPALFIRRCAGEDVPEAV